MLKRRLIAIIKGERGITLMEIAISMLLFAIVGIFILYGVAAASFSLALADERNTAKNLAESEIEYLKLTSYDSLPTLPWSYDLPDLSPDWDGSHTLPPDHDNYSMLVQGSAVDIDNDGSNDDGIQLITITVSHNEKSVYNLSDYVLDPMP
jgi:hypothetical protein